MNQTLVWQKPKESAEDFQKRLDAWTAEHATALAKKAALLKSMGMELPE